MPKIQLITSRMRCSVFEPSAPSQLSEDSAVMAKKPSTNTGKRSLNTLPMLMCSAFASAFQYQVVMKNTTKGMLMTRTTFQISPSGHRRARREGRVEREAGGEHLARVQDARAHPGAELVVAHRERLPDHGRDEHRHDAEADDGGDGEGHLGGLGAHAGGGGDRGRDAAHAAGRGHGADHRAVHADALAEPHDEEHRAEHEAHDEDDRDAADLREPLQRIERAQHDDAGLDEEPRRPEARLGPVRDSPAEDDVAEDHASDDREQDVVQVQHLYEPALLAEDDSVL